MRGELDWLVLRALEKDRTRRCETANALSRDIQRYPADEVVEAQPLERVCAEPRRQRRTHRGHTSCLVVIPKQGADCLRVDLTVEAVNLFRHARGPLVDTARHLRIQRLTMQSVAQHRLRIGEFLGIRASRLRLGAHALIFAILDPGSMLAV